MFHFILPLERRPGLIRSSAPLSVAEALTDRNAMAQCADSLGSPFSVPHRDTSCASGPRGRRHHVVLVFHLRRAPGSQRQPGGRQQPAAANAVPRATPTAIDWSALSSVPIRRPRLALQLVPPTRTPPSSALYQVYLC